MRLSTLFKGAATAIMLGGVLLVAGCSLGGTKSDVSTASVQGQFDATIKAYKDGQFLVDGAVLSALDTGSHFAYLKDQGKLPKTVLLERSDESKIRKQHLQYMACADGRSDEEQGRESRRLRSVTAAILTKRVAVTLCLGAAGRRYLLRCFPARRARCDSSGHSVTRSAIVQRGPGQQPAREHAALTSVQQQLPLTSANLPPEYR